MRHIVLLLAIIALLLLSRHPRQQYYKDRIIQESHSPDVKESIRSRLGEVEKTIAYFLAHAPADCPKIQRIRDRWNGQIHETKADDHPNEALAYSVNKGEAIHVCVRDASTGGLSDLNAILFVVFHELAHVAETEYGHGQSFFDTMTYLLELADKMGVYRYQDHEAEITTVCGRKLGHNPLTCVKKNTCESTLKKK